MLDLLSIATDGMLSAMASPGDYIGPVPLSAASLGYLYPIFEPIPVPILPHRRVGGGGGSSAGKTKDKKSEVREQYEIRIKVILASVNSEEVSTPSSEVNYAYPKQTDINVDILKITAFSKGYSVTINEMFASITKPNVVVGGAIGVENFKPFISSAYSSHKIDSASIIKTKVLSVKRKQGE